MATIMGGGGDKATKIIHTIAPLIAVGVGINATLNQATAANFAMNPQNNTAPFNQKVTAFVSLVAGPQAGASVGKAIGFPVPASGLPAANFTPAKALNPTSISGAGILIANYILKELGVPGYNKFAAPIIGAIGTGTLVGGVVGGIFDPPSPTNPAAIGNPAGRLAFAQAATPFLGAAGAAMPGTMGGLAGFNTGRGTY
jgi:DNA-binding beta-propeller fold protein YncE